MSLPDLLLPSVKMMEEPMQLSCPKDNFLPENPCFLVLASLRFGGQCLSFHALIDSGAGANLDISFILITSVSSNRFWFSLVTPA